MFGTTDQEGREATPFAPETTDPQPRQRLSVLNLSSRSLSEEEISVLEKSLSFVPSQKAKSFETRVELFKFL